MIYAVLQAVDSKLYSRRLIPAIRIGTYLNHTAPHRHLKDHIQGFNIQHLELRRDEGEITVSFRP